MITFVKEHLEVNMIICYWEIDQLETQLMKDCAK